MRKREVKLIITFHTTTAAIEMEQICKKENGDGRLIPVPKEITAGCGLAWCAPLSSERRLRTLMQDHGIVCQGIYECMV